MAVGQGDFALVNRLKREHPEQEIHFVSRIVCMRATMFRIALAHLCGAVENPAAGPPVNLIRSGQRDGRQRPRVAQEDAGSEVRPPTSRSLSGSASCSVARAARVVGFASLSPKGP